MTWVRHLERAISWVRESMSEFRAWILGSAGFWVLRWSLSSISGWISGLVVGLKFLRKPEGMVVFEASRRTLLKVLTAVYVEVGGGRLLNLVSVMEVKDGQSARLKFVYERRVRIGGCLRRRRWRLAGGWS